MLQMELPPEVHLLTLELLEPNIYLLRLEHQFESNDPVYNTTVTVSLKVSSLYCTDMSES